MKKNKKSNNKNTKPKDKKSDIKIKNNNEDKEIWKKIFLFMIILFPYALYLFLFKTKVSKYIKAFVVLLISILLIVVFDTVRYPDRIHDEIVFSHIQKVKSESVVDVGTVYNVEKKVIFEYKGNEYIAYNLYDESDMYYGIFKIKDYSKDYDLVYLYRLSNEFELVYSDNTFLEFNKIHPIVFVHMLTDTNLYTFKKISDASEISINDIFENDKYQTISIDNNEINFRFNDYGVIEYASKSKDVEYNAQTNPLMNTEFKTVYKVLRRNFQDEYKIVGFSYYDIMPVFNIMVGDSKYIVQYYYGEGASLKSIDSEKEYFEFLKEKYNVNSLNR